MHLLRLSQKGDWCGAFHIKSFSELERFQYVRSKSTQASSFIWLLISILIVLIFLPVSSAFCPSKCVCDDDTLKVQCTNTSLDIIPFLLNPETTSLRLPYNKIETIGQSLAFYPELREIDLSHNQINSFDSQDFEGQVKLEILNLNKNKFNMLVNLSFLKLINMRELYLSNNLISVIQPKAFGNTFELRVLDLSNNNLKVLSENTFAESGNLEILKLNYNYFTYMPSSALQKIPSLKEIEMSGNLISEISSRSFRLLENLSSITLDKNNISVIHPDSFEGISHLKTLSLKDNRLMQVSGVIFTPLRFLQNLDLSGNLFEGLDRSSLSSLSTLKHLRISRCPRLHRLDSQTFSSLTSLETLKLNHNARLVYLGDSIFSSLVRLTDLDLTACGLVYVHRDQMPPNPTTQLHLAGNPFNCNCSLLWLATLTFNESFHFDTPTCATPPNLYGIPVTNVDLRAAGCPQHLGVAAIGTCVGIILLSLLAASLFLVWRWRQRAQPATKTLQVVSENGIRSPWNSTLNSGGPLGINGSPVYTPKYCLPTALTVAPCGHTTNINGCPQNMNPLPYSFHPVTRPLLTPPSPSLHNQLPIDWYYPSPYDDETHWYTTIGKDGREYLTGELKRDRMPPPKGCPPPPPISSIPTSLPPSGKLRRQNSYIGHGECINNHRNLVSSRTQTPNLPMRAQTPNYSTCSEVPNSETSNHTSSRTQTPNLNASPRSQTPCTTPVINRTPEPDATEVFKLQEGVTLGDITRNPVTYI